MNEFFTSNAAKYRLARTIVQGIIGVIIANLDVIIGMTAIPLALRPMIVALVMAVLSPIMAMMGKDVPAIQQGYNVESIDELNDEDAEVIYYDYDCPNHETEE